MINFVVFLIVRVVFFVVKEFFLVILSLFFILFKDEVLFNMFGKVWVIILLRKIIIKLYVKKKGIGSYFILDFFFSCMFCIVICLSLVFDLNKFLI